MECTDCIILAPKKICSRGTVCRNAFLCVLLASVRMKHRSKQYYLYCNVKKKSANFIQLLCDLVTHTASSHFLQQCVHIICGVMA